MSDNYNTKRIFKNTMLLYVRMLFTMGINLYTTRLVLTNLGVEDYGVYGIVGGLVSMFALFSVGANRTVQRFISYELGKKDGDVNNVFCTSINVIIIIFLLTFVVLEVGGLWFLKNRLNIPEHSLNAAEWVFQLSVATCLLTMINIPYNALLVAFERFDIFAYISLCQVILNCIVAYCLTFYENNRLFIYALGLTGVSLIIQLLYWLFCRVKIKASRYQTKIDKVLLKQIGKFAGITVADGALQVCTSQGINILINLTFGVALNAVYSLSLQLKNMVLSFAQNVQRAVDPQITKSYSNNEMSNFFKLVNLGSKLQGMLILFIVIPFFFRADQIINLWLGKIPDNTILFMKGTILLSLIFSITEPIKTGAIATGRIKRFLLIPDFIFLLVIPIIFIGSKFIHDPLLIIVSIVIMEGAIPSMLRLILMSHITNFNLLQYTKAVLLPILLVGIFSSIICYFIDIVCSKTFLGLVLLLILNSIFVLLNILLFGFSKSEREKIMLIILKLKK